VFDQSDRRNEAQTGRHNVRTATFAPRLEHHRTVKEEGFKMKKFVFATIAASGLVAAILGFAALAQAATDMSVPTALASAINVPTGIDHHAWLDDIQQHAKVPRVDTTVQQSR
jgi:hypothetical protein